VFRLDYLLLLSLLFLSSGLSTHGSFSSRIHLWWGLGDDFGLTDGWAMLVFHLDCLSF
jgi:hypothetical protein